MDGWPTSRHPRAQSVFHSRTRGCPISRAFCEKWGLFMFIRHRLHDKFTLRFPNAERSEKVLRLQCVEHEEACREAEHASQSGPARIGRKPRSVALEQLPGLMPAGRPGSGCERLAGSKTEDCFCLTVVFTSLRG